QPDDPADLTAFGAAADRTQPLPADLDPAADGRAGARLAARRSTRRGQPGVARIRRWRAPAGARIRRWALRRARPGDATLVGRVAGRRYGCDASRVGLGEGGPARATDMAGSLADLGGARRTCRNCRP